MVGAYEGHHGRQFRRQPRHHSAHRDVPSGGGTCKIERGSRSDSYSCSIRFRFDSRKKGFCKRLTCIAWPGRTLENSGRVESNPSKSNVTAKPTMCILLAFLGKKLKKFWISLVGDALISLSKKLVRTR